MILPSKHLPQEKALLTVGAKLLQFLDRPKTISAVWQHVRNSEMPVSYDWFVLALDLLYIIGAIELQNGLLSRRPAA
ncbi:MAG: hypothetical protein MUF15_08710 [Acidobacteria bacterium]|jgi:hypothetical protein|nr:hypothetical protein [Acidobacteriota bacterium]